MNEPSADKPKIVVDSDWKAQVEAEKAQLRRQASSEPAPAPAAEKSAARPAASSQPESASSVPEEPLPPASFSWLVTSIATQAMVALGQIPDPFENKPVVRLTHARHHIDLLNMLEGKTQGNLASDEKALLAHVLTDLRMAYVAVESRAKATRK